MPNRAQPALPRFEAGIDRLLRSLLSLPTGPYHESAIASLVLRHVRRMGLDVERDCHGNLLVQYRFGRASGSLGWIAHMDHPALETVPCPDGKGACARFLGFLRPEYLRGASLLVADGRRERRKTRVVSVPTRGWPATKLVRLDPETAPEPGTLLVFDLPDYERSGSRIRARQCDDLAGVGAVLAMFRELIRRKVHGEVWGIFTRAEEEGFIGAIGLADAGILAPEQPLISVECSAERPTALLGKGFVVRVADRILNFDPATTRALTRIAAELAAEDRTFHWQRALMDGGICEASALLAAGYRTGAVCVPLRNYHNMGEEGRLAPEIISLQDLAGLVRFMVEVSGRRREFDQALPAIRRRFEKRTASARRRLVLGTGDASSEG